jgi:NAD(P)-dependent dehydrogenase (short-subunit alcohol dehydrogenase family)
VQAAVAAAADFCDGLDVVVNNAGVIQVGPQEQMTRADFEESLQTHFWGAYNTIQAAWPHLPKPGGRIVNISSIGGQIAVPHLLPYSVGKFALVGYSNGLRDELAAHGVHVTTVCPGLMRTGSHVNAFFKGQHQQEFAWFSIADAFPLLSTTAEHAAQQIVDACRYGDPSLTITVPAKLAVGLSRLMPGVVAAVNARVAAALPDPAGAEGRERWTGWQSFSDRAPSRLTRPADEAVAPNNELRGHAPPA